MVFKIIIVLEVIEWFNIVIDICCNSIVFVVVVKYILNEGFYFNSIGCSEFDLIG